MADATQLTSEEIQHYREQLKANPEALDVLDLIEELEGDLIESTNILAIEAGFEIRKRSGEGLNILDKFALEFRSIICDDDFIDDLMSGLLTAALGTLAAIGQIPQALATPRAISF